MAWDDAVVSFPGGKINHVNPILRVANLADSVDFYTRMLGMDVHHTLGEPADFAIIGRDGLQIYLCQGGQGQAGTWLAMFVSDPLALREHLVASGIAVLEPDEGGAGEYRVEDPDGHVLRLFG
jgi:catechol 2,3-dioxygenase-like lactoylglutathione lyase family enzyme